MRVPRQITLIVDSREKYPLLFPANVDWHADRGLGGHSRIRVKLKVKKLEWADYAISGHEASAGVERKGSLDELCQNLMTDDRERFITAIRRFRENCDHPYILIDASPADLWTPTPRCSNPAAVWDALCEVIDLFHLRLLWAGHAKSAGHRRILGEQVLRILLSHALRGN